MIKDNDFMKRTYSCRQHSLCGGRLIVEHYWNKERVNILPKVGLEFRKIESVAGITLALDFLNVGASVCIVLWRKRR